MKKQRSPMPPPPWLRDSESQNWVPASVAARFYFRRSVVTVKRRIKDGSLMRDGIPSYWDGTSWFIRLPIMLTKTFEPLESVERRMTLKKSARKQNLLRQHGLRIEDYNALERHQGGVCAICRRPPTNRPLAVDHDHGTGKNRGLLCFNCNGGLGLFRDDIDILEAAILYLKKHSPRTNTEQPVQTEQKLA